MDTVLAGLKWHTCLVYLNDVVVFSPNFDENIARLQSVLEAIRTSGLMLKTEKCLFAYERLKFFGHVINAEGVLPDPAKTTAIAKFPRAKDRCAKILRTVRVLQAVRRKLGKNRRSAHALDKRQRSVLLGGNSTLQNRLQRPPVFLNFEESAEREMHKDASEVGLGAVLVQKQNGCENVIAYASRGLSKTERTYSASEKVRCHNMGHLKVSPVRLRHAVQGGDGPP